ncbi:MAG: alpha/beta hydrolase [Lentilitoribacter sp.]
MTNHHKSQFPIHDWDLAYDNRGYVPNIEKLIGDLPEKAADYRSKSNCKLNISYGATERMVYDLFMPESTPIGLMVFIHGGYWHLTDKSVWSHLAKGAVDSGWAVILPSYELCPNVKIADITTMLGNAINQAAQNIEGPIVLSGHSAGGHLVCEMMSEGSPLGDDVIPRLKKVISISGLCDLRPLLNTKMNDVLDLDINSAKAASPALKVPLKNIPLVAWVGAAERAEFLRQNALIANIWHGLGVDITIVEEPDKHHFSVVEGMRDQNSALVNALLDI